jgi:hypothetical protein
MVQTMYLATYTLEDGWKGQTTPYQCLLLDPAAQVLNYGQSLFEGMKAQRSADGSIVLFRPQENAARMAQGARGQKMFLRFLNPAGTIRREQDVSPADCNEPQFGGIISRQEVLGSRAAV